VSVLQKRQTSLRASIFAIAFVSMSCAAFRCIYDYRADRSYVMMYAAIAYICMFGAIGTLFRPTSDLFAYVTAFGFMLFFAVVMLCLGQ